MTSTKSDGTPLGSRYLLDQPIGQGAFGKVWRGRRRSDGMPVAIKVLRGEYVSDAEVVTRFMRERAALQELSHPYLVPVEDLVVEGDTVAVVMELVDGENLRRASRRGWLGVDGALTLLAQVAHALAYIHSAGVLHRDIKPENILLTRRDDQPWARLADFGLAWMGDSHQLTRKSQVVGSPAYMAPELLTGGPCGPPVDVYALGVTAYELLSGGQRPFDAENALALMRAHLDEEPRQPPGMADEHWQLVKACLAKQPDQRPTAARLVTGFENLRSGGVSVRLGIAFGTCTTTAVLRRPGGRIEPLVFDGSPLLPSAVYVQSSGVVLTGRQALDAAKMQPERCDPYPRLRLAEGTVRLGDQEVRPVDLVTAVLRRVAKQARRAVGRIPARVTITHPAGWDAARLALLARAARAAGLPAPCLVTEPVATVAHLVDSPAADLPTGTCAVIYDLGATTTTASVVRRTADGGLDLLASERLADTGGVNLDAAILDRLGQVISEHAPDEWRRLSNPDDPNDLRATWQLWRDVQHARETLSRATVASVEIPLIGRTLSLDRRQVEMLARPVLDRALAATGTALASAGVPAREVTATFLVGGVTRMPLVATLLQRALGHAPTAVARPEFAVAEGATHLTPAGAAPATSSGGLAHLLAAPQPSDPGRWPPDGGASSRRRSTASGSPGGRGSPADWRAPSLRRRLVVSVTATALVLAALATVGYRSLPDASVRADAGPACGYKIAYLGSLNPFGKRIHNAASLAVEEYNAGHPGCTVELAEYNAFNPANGLDELAGKIVGGLVADPRILGVVGPIFDPEVTPAMPALNGAGIASILPKVHDTAYGGNRWRVFHRMVGNNLDDAVAAARYLRQVRKKPRTFVVDDNSRTGLAASAVARRHLGAALAGSASIIKPDADQSALVKKIITSGATTVFYTGYPDAFGPLLKQLRPAAPNVTVLAGQDAIVDPLVKEVGKAADDVLTTCTCVPPSRAGANFDARYHDRFKSYAPSYAAETFDAANVLLSGIAAGKATRRDLLAWVNAYDSTGVTGRIAFKANGDRVTVPGWVTRISGGAYLPQTPIPDTPLGASPR